MSDGGLDGRAGEENIGLAYKACWLYRGLWGSLDEEEAMSVALFAYVRACRLFDPSRGRLSTYVYTAVRRSLLRELQAQRRRPAPVDMHSPPAVRDAEPLIDLPGWIESMPDHLVECVRWRLAVETLEEIGRRVGVTKEMVRLRLREAQRFVLEHAEGEDLALAERLARSKTRKRRYRP